MHRKLRIIFWTLFIALPLFNRLSPSIWLPQEYDLLWSQLLDSHVVACSVEEVNVASISEISQNKKTLEACVNSQFQADRKSHYLRQAIEGFIYGLIGCFFYSWDQSRRNKTLYKNLLQRSLLFNLLISCLPLIYIV